MHTYDPRPPTRRARLRAALAAAGLLALLAPVAAAAADDEPHEIVNVASRDFEGAPNVEVSYVPGWNNEAALHDGTPAFNGHGSVWGTYGQFVAEHWAQYTWDEPVTVSRSRIWFWHDEPNPGNVRMPASWHLEYRDLGTGEWVEIDAEYPIPTGTGQVYGPVEITFAEVETDALRAVLAAQPRTGSQPFYSVASTEWEVWGYQYVEPPPPEDPDAPILYEEVHVRALAGGPAELPAQLWGIAENGPLRYLDVTWDEVPALESVGEVSVPGVVDDFAADVTATVHVVEDLDAALEDVEYSATVTEPGVAPVCPSTVLGTYADGSRSSAVPVEWAAVDPAEYAEPEAFFDVEGTVPGLDAPAVCTVFVLERVADGGPVVDLAWLDAPAGSGWYTTHPSFEVTADGTGLLAVEYSLDGGETWHPYTAATAVTTEGDVEVRVRATDSENRVGTASADIRVDTLGPQTTVDWELTEAGTAADFTLTADDGEVGSGVARTLYSAGPDPDPENPDELNDMWATYEGPFSITLAQTPLYVHVHSQDAAGNQEVTRTIELPALPDGPALDVVADTRCVVGRVVTTVRVGHQGVGDVEAVITAPHGTRTVTVGEGRATSVAFSSRLGSVPAGEVSVSATAAGSEASSTTVASYAARSCG